MQRRWSEAEDSFIRDNYGQMSPRDIATHLDRTKDLVVWRAGTLGVRTPRNPSWSAAEDEFLRLNYPTMPIKDISAHLGRSYQAIQLRADRKGVTKVGNPGSTWTEDEDDLLRDLHGVMELTEVATYLGRTPAAVRHRASRLALNKRIRHERTPKPREDTVLTMRWDVIRHDYFAEIDNPMKAYLLGWLASDGNVKKRENTIRLRLNRKDEEILHLFRRELAPFHPVTPYEGRRSSGETSPMGRFEVNSEQMKCDLIRLGVTPDKTLTFQYPPIPAEFDAPFLLGYFDGDGSLCRNGRYWRWTIVGASESFLVATQDRIEAAVGTRPRGPHRHMSGSRAKRIQLDGSHVIPVDAWLHTDIDGLARKSLRFREADLDAHRRAA